MQWLDLKVAGLEEICVEDLGSFRQEEHSCEGIASRPRSHSYFSIPCGHPKSSSILRYSAKELGNPARVTGYAEERSWSRTGPRPYELHEQYCPGKAPGSLLVLPGWAKAARFEYLASAEIPWVSISQDSMSLVSWVPTIAEGPLLSIGRESKPEEDWGKAPKGILQYLYVCFTLFLLRKITSYLKIETLA